MGDDFGLHAYGREHETKLPNLGQKRSRIQTVVPVLSQHSQNRAIDKSVSEDDQQNQSADLYHRTNATDRIGKATATTSTTSEH